MTRVMTIFGTRPEAVKLAPVLQALGRRALDIEPIVCSTGQHRDMLAPLCELFGIVPDIELNVMKDDQTQAELTARLFADLGPIIRDIKPDWIVAQGDTTTVLVASLLSYYNQVRFAHVEAGLRTGHLQQPFPEELNRRVASMVADFHFAPTESAAQRLLNEGVPTERILVTGNTVIDALNHVAALPYDWSAGPLRRVPRDRRLVLVTAHRREAFGETLREFCYAVGELAQQFATLGVSFVYPVHPNPNVRGPVGDILSSTEGIILLDPLDYLSFVNLLKRATLALTDSGGVQEEAPTFGVPVLVAREMTERPEGIRAGVAKLVGRSREKIMAEVSTLLTDAEAHRRMAKRTSPYGDGQAAVRIAAALSGFHRDRAPTCRSDLMSLEFSR